MHIVRACVCNITVFYLVIMTVQYVTELNAMLTAGANFNHNNIGVKQYAVKQYAVKQYAALSC